MSNIVRHPYHLVDESPWPLYSSFGALLMALGLLKWFHSMSSSVLLCALSVMGLVMWQWWEDVSSEGANQGLHSSVVEVGLRAGMILFIISEVFFFLSFFWAFFHSSLSPTIELGGVWPPLGVHPFNPLGVPLLNTIVLLSSGVSVTWAHHAIMSGGHKMALHGLGVTILLGGYFTCLQGLEYYEASFSMADSVYGATFFLATGFHGFHVIVGSLFLSVCLMRLKMGHFSLSHHFGLEAAAWYWHFVDVVWLFLFLSMYWWGGL